MSNQFPRTPMPGIGAEQHSHAPRNGALTILLLLCTFFLGQAQYPSELDTLPLNSVTHSLVFPCAPLAAGDTLEIVFKLGAALDSVSHAVGFQIEIELSNKLVQEVCEPFSADNSWLLYEPAGTSGTHADTSFMDPYGAAVLHLRSLRLDTLKPSGFGEIFRFKVIAKEAIDDPDGLVSPSGGMVLVDNVEMKTAHLPIPCPIWSLAPNPADGWVRVVADKLAGSSVELMNLQGEVLHSVQDVGKKTALGAVQDLPEGLYLVRMRNENGCQEMKKLVVKH